MLPYDHAHLVLKTNVADWSSLTDQQLVVCAHKKSKNTWGSFHKFLAAWNDLLSISYQEAKARIVSRVAAHNATALPDIPRMNTKEYKNSEPLDGIVWHFESDDDDYYHPDFYQWILDRHAKEPFKKQRVWWHQWCSGDEHSPYAVGRLGRFNYVHSNNHLDVFGDPRVTEGKQCIHKHPSANDSLSYAMKSPWSLSYFNRSARRRKDYWGSLNWRQKIVRLHQCYIRNVEEEIDNIPDDTWWKPHWLFTYEISKEALGDLIDIHITPEVDI